MRWTTTKSRYLSIYAHICLTILIYSNDYKSSLFGALDCLPDRVTYCDLNTDGSSFAWVWASWVFSWCSSPTGCRIVGSSKTIWFLDSSVLWGLLGIFGASCPGGVCSSDLVISLSLPLTWVLFRLHSLLAWLLATTSWPLVPITVAGT